jgi:hypothetical protein
MTYPETFNELDKWRDELRPTVSPADLIRALADRAEHESDPVRVHILNCFLIEEHLAQGNQAEAEVIRLKDPVEEIHRWHCEWCEANDSADIIPVLEEKLRSESHPMKARLLRHFMVEEYMIRRDFAAIAAAYQDAFNADPSEPMPLISLAGHKLYRDEEPEEAMQIIGRAVDVALRSGTFRRLALGVKARIALRLQDYRIVEDVLRQIMDLQFTRGNADVGVERDFLDRVPPGRIDPEVARRYDEYCRARGRLPKGGPDSPDEPPEFELPEWE